MMRRHVALCALAAWVAVASQACSSSVDKETQITLALESETEIPAELDAFAVRVFATRTGELRFSQEYFPTSGRDFPATLAVIPSDESSLDSPLRIEVEGRKNGKVLATRHAVLSYFKSRNILLALPLRMACFPKDCGTIQTCAGGQCVDATVDPKTVRDYDSKLVFPEPDTCFDEQKCLDAKNEVRVDEDCSFPIPDGLPETQGNVAIRWAAAPARVLGLESDDAQEGWIRTAPGRGRLSQGACDSHFQRKGPDGALLVPDVARNVYFTSTCPSKTRETPFCFSQQTFHAGVGAIAP